jgi:hypothetical protein
VYQYYRGCPLSRVQRHYWHVVIWFVMTAYFKRGLHDLHCTVFFEIWPTVLLCQIIDKYQWNDDCSGSYLGFLEAQNSALREPGIGCLFLPSERYFHALRLEDTRWLYPDITEGYTDAELGTRLGSLWFEPGNIQSVRRYSGSWNPDFSDLGYIAHLDSVSYAFTRV